MDEYLQAKECLYALYEGMAHLGVRQTKTGA